MALLRKESLTKSKLTRRSVMLRCGAGSGQLDISKIGMPEDQLFRFEIAEPLER